MYKIYNHSVLHKLLLFIPFVGIITHRLSPIYAYVTIVAFGIILLLFKIKTNQINKTQLFFSSIILLNLYIVFLYQLIFYDYINLYYIQFFGSQILFYYLIVLFVDIQKVYKLYLKQIFKILIYFIAFFIVIDFILINIGMSTSQLMYKPEAFSYFGKPLGLFGQFSINATYAVVFYMLYLSFQKEQNMTNNIFLFFLITLTVFLQDSGTGYIIYLFLLFSIFYKSLILRILLIPSIIVSIILIIQSGIVAKLSSEYFYFLYEYFLEIFKVTYIDNIHNVFDVLFGIDGNYNFPIDFGPMFMIAKVGFLYFALYSFVIFYIIYKAPDRYFRMAIISLVVANIHYPALFYPIMNILLPVLFIYIINLKKSQLT